VNRELGSHITAPELRHGNDGTTESVASAVSWGAIFAGGFSAAGISLVLLAFGAGLGLSTISPWSGVGVTTKFKVSVGIYFIVMAIMASAVGGYLTGRLRTRWVAVHTREVFFRDTAHGLIAWAFATVLSLTVLAAPASALLGGATEALAGANANSTSITDGFVNHLIRPAASGNASTGELLAWRGEVEHLYSAALKNGEDLSDADRAYLAQIVSTHTGLSAADAAERVSATFSDARAAADQVRKAAAQMSLWVAASLLAGALAASLAAIEGGGLRDGTWHYKA
jgi:hypothetical protein